VIREWRFVGGTGNLLVSLNDIPLYGVGTDEHVVLPVPPGEHIVGVTWRGLGGNEATAAVRAEPKGRYYFYVETGLFDPGPFLHPTTPANGLRLMEKTTRIGP